MAYVRRSISTNIEKQILTGMILSNRYLKDVYLMIDRNYFQSEYAKKLVDWVLFYFRKYEKAPCEDIESIYLERERELKEDEAEIMKSFLDSLLKEIKNKNKFNIEYLLDRTIEYFRQRALILTIENIKILVDNNKLDDAEKIIKDYKKVSKAISKWINPFDEKQIKRLYETKFIKHDEAENPDTLFKLQGKLGSLLGWFKRGWLCAFMGPVKRGKTWFLQEGAIQAYLCRLRVVFITLEMSDEEMKKRFIDRLFAYTSVNTKDQHLIYPCFDCVKNQTGECRKPQRTNKIALYNEERKIPEYNLEMEYRPCVACRGVSKDYEAATWFEWINREEAELKKLIDGMKGFEMYFGDRMRIIAYPEYSANISQIKKDLDDLEYIDDFVPDVVIIDYADILAPEDKRVQGRDRIDETWKTLKNLSSTRHCLILTATQANKKTLEKKNVKAIDTSEDYRKMAHADAIFSLSQTDNEKKKGIMRVGIVIHRHQEFDQLNQVTVLQNLNMGQPVLDSEFKKMDKEEDDKSKN
jgi:hypothetical protein